MDEQLREIVRYVNSENQLFRKSLNEDFDRRLADFRKQGGGYRSIGGDSNSVASEFVNSGEYRSYLVNAKSHDYPKFTWRCEGKAVSTVILGTVPNSIAPPVQVGPSLLPQYPSRLRQLIPSRPVSSEYIIGVRESGSEGEAGIQALEGDVKPQIDMKFVPTSFELRQYSAWSKISVQCLEDVGWVQDVLDNNLAVKIGQAEDKQNVTDLNAAATAWAGGVAGDTALDLIAKAQGTLESAGWTVTGTLVNPADLTTLRLLKDRNDNYMGTPTWLGPIVGMKDIAAGNFLTGAFSTAATILDRESSVKIEMGWVNDDFIRNLRTVVAEQRSYLWIGQPSGFLKGSLTAPVTAAKSAR